ncbi:hypothetical protein H6B10_17450, partial [Gemmiger formicilis]|nr:hypothetical protein [Gemmiger formicilis]
LLMAMRPYFDFVLLDTAAGMGAPFTAAAAVADKALLVLRQNMPVCGAKLNHQLLLGVVCHQGNYHNATPSFKT